jgi:hypothetical protein
MSPDSLEVVVVNVSAAPAAADSPAKTPPNTDSREKITPFIENAIVELALLTVKLVTTPFAVLFYTRDFRDQIEAFHNNELNARFSPTVARPLSFYVLWMAVHFLLASSYWHYVLQEHSQFGDLTRQVPEQFKKGAAFLKNQAWTDITGHVEALIVIAFAVTLIIGIKSALVTVIARLIRCPVRFETVLYASAYTMGTLLFFQYAFILGHYSIEAIFATTQSQPAGYYVLIYGSLLICIVLTVRINQMIRIADGTREAPTFVSWFIGTLIWLYLIILATGVVFGTKVGIAEFAMTIVNAFIPHTFDVSL